MPNYSKNDVILVRYPFSNLSNFKVYEVDLLAIACKKLFYRSKGDRPHVIVLAKCTSSYISFKLDV